MIDHAKLIATPTQDLIGCLEVLYGSLVSNADSAELLQARDAALAEFRRRLRLGDQTAKALMDEMREEQEAQEA